MAFNELLAKRTKVILKDLPGLTEIKMFGGICFTIRGNMAIGIEKDNLVIRVGKENYESALKQNHTRPFDLTGRPLKGFVYVSQKGCTTPAALKKWIFKGIDDAKSLPPKIK